MPCRSDYMEPTEREKNRGNKIVTDLNTLADELTYANDVLREYLLGETKVRPLGHVNLTDRFSSTLKRLKDQRGGLYAPAIPRSLPGLFSHVKELLAEYQVLNAFVTRTRVIHVTDMDTIRERQNEHREADLSRLMKTFAASGDRLRLRAVLDADSTKPLEPQLGFSPDDF